MTRTKQGGESGNVEAASEKNTVNDRLVLARSRTENCCSAPYSPLTKKQLSSPLYLAIAMGAIAAPLLLHLACYWQIDPQYCYGWIVPFLGVYLAWRCRPSRPAPKPEPRGTTACVVAAMVCLSLVWLIREATPDWSVVSWILAILTVCIVILLVTKAAGLCTARHFLFPICFVLTAVPWPHQLEVAIVQNLMRFVAVVAAECANWAGIPALARGNLIQLTHDYVGIDEACSGIRSLQAILMASLFLGEFLQYPVLRRGLFVLLGVATAIFCNVARTVALVLVASSCGSDALRAWHDQAGIAVLVTAFAFLGLLASWIPAGNLSALPETSKSEPSARGRCSLPLAPAVIICIWVTATFAVTNYWYRSSGPGSLRLEIHWPENQNAFRYLAMPDEAQHVLLCTEGRIATWHDSGGDGWTLFALRWASGRTATQSARLHRPENCFTASGAVLKRELEPTSVMINAIPITFRSYLFERNGVPIIVFYTIWEEANPDRLSGRLLQDYSGLSRLQRVLAHERNFGQQSLEFVLTGGTDFTEAQSRFKHTLPILLSWKRA
jgi:exosortase